MNAPRVDRWGDPIEDDDNQELLTEVPGVSDTTTRTRDEIHTDRCAELRRILKSARERREAQP